VLRKIFGAKREEVMGGWRKLHNEQLRSLSSSIKIGMVKSRRIKSANYEKGMGRKIIHISYWWEI
jgi:hypothetical protein